MNSKTESLDNMREFLTNRNYQPATISSYIFALESLFNFYSDVKPTEINFNQLADFTHYLLKRKKLSNSTVRLNLSAFDLFYNSFHRNKFDIKPLKPTVSTRNIPEILTPDEVKRLLQAIPSNTNHYMMISLIYSTGLGLSQVRNLRIEDVNCEKKEIKVRNSNKNVIRTVILADHLVKQMRIYTQFRPTNTWLFECRGKDKPFSSSSIRKAFKNALLAAGIKKKVTIQNLKFTYIKHTEFYGTSLPVILEEMGIFSNHSYFKYSQIGLTEKTVSFSPLDRILHEGSTTNLDTTPLEKSFASIRDKHEKSYLLESIKCFKAMAPRAAIILAWNAAIRNIQNNCLKKELNMLNKAIKKHNPKAPQISSIDDFEKIKEKLILETSYTLKIFSKHEKDILVTCLDIRNKCGHPGSYMPKEHRVASFLEDLYNIVFSKPALNKSARMEIENRVSEYEDISF